MKKKLLLAICFVMLTSAFAFADETGEKKAVMKLLEITNARNMTDQLMKSMEAMMSRQFEAAAADLPPEGREALEAVRKDSMKWLFDNLSWDQMRDMYIDIYSQVFTEDEINELVQFYESPLGRKMLKKMPELMRLTLEKSQAIVQKKMPIFQENLQKTLSDLETKYNNKSSRMQEESGSLENREK